MADLLHLNLTNAILPMVLLGVLCIVTPALLAGETLSQRSLALAVLGTALLVWAAGAAILMWLTVSVNGEAGPLWSHIRRSGLFALLWGPLLALVWFMRAQGVERRKGARMGR